VPNGEEDVSFRLHSGRKHDILPWPTASAGMEAELDLITYSPDFSILRIDGMLEERTLYGA
jgi:hypothetical protein